MPYPNNKEELLEALKSIYNPTDTSAAKEGYRYIIYVRKSTDESENQVRSLADQILECKDFAIKHNLKFSEKDILEEAESAKEPGIRPKFKMMIDALNNGKYDGIIAWHPDRLARNMKDAGEIIDLVDKAIIKDLKFVSFTFTNDASGKMLLGITFVLSKQYSDKLSDDVNRGNKHSILEGKYINRPKYGYYKDRNKFLRPDGKNFNLIKNSFRMRLEGKTMDDIANYLNENSYSRLLPNGERFFPKLDKQRIERFLKDPVYTGILMYGKKNIVDLTTIYDFMPMLSVEDFMKINKLSDKSQLFKLSKSYRKAESIKANLLRGIVFCHSCDEAMASGITPKKTKKGITRYFYYRCENEDCPRYGKSVRAKVIMEYIYAFLDKKPFASKKSYDHYKAEMTHVSEQRILDAKDTLMSLKAQKRKLHEKLLNTKDLLLNNKDEEIKVHFKGDLKVIDTEIGKVAEAIAKTEGLIEKGKASILTYAQFLELMEKMPILLRSLKNMSELDYIIRKMFLNFTVSAKSVEKSTLNSPFDVLDEHKVLQCAR